MAPVFLSVSSNKTVSSRTKNVKASNYDIYAHLETPRRLNLLLMSILDCILLSLASARIPLNPKGNLSV